MAVYEYKAFDAQGRQKKGIVDAEHVRAARQKLKLQGLFPTTLSESDQSPARARGALPTLTIRSQRVSTAELAIMTRQLATLVGAGMPLVEALRALGDQIDNTGLRKVIAEVGEAVNEGSTLANAMREHKKTFPRLYVNMVASGEASGSLELVLGRLADLLESQAAFRRKVSSALTYPILMLCLCFGVVVLLLTYVVPQISQMFADRKAVLPLPTRVVIGLSNFLLSYWFLVAALIVGIVSLVRWYLRTPNGRRRRDAVMLKLPIIGPLVLKVATTRFAKNLGTMLISGVELLSALTITKNIIGNLVLEEAIEKATEGVREGGSLAAELEKSRVFPRLLIHMVAIGEKTGQLETMLDRAANSYESEVQAVVASFTSILEPVLILCLSVVVGGILAAVMLPMLEMSSLQGIK